MFVLCSSVIYRYLKVSNLIYLSPRKPEVCILFSRKFRALGFVHYAKHGPGSKVFFCRWKANRFKWFSFIVHRGAKRFSFTIRAGRKNNQNFVKYHNCEAVHLLERSVQRVRLLYRSLFTRGATLFSNFFPF